MRTREVIHSWGDNIPTLFPEFLESLDTDKMGLHCRDTPSGTPPANIPRPPFMSLTYGGVFGGFGEARQICMTLAVTTTLLPLVSQNLSDFSTFPLNSLILSNPIILLEKILE